MGKLQLVVLFAVIASAYCKPLIETERGAVHERDDQEEQVHNLDKALLLEERIYGHVNNKTMDLLNAECVTTKDSGTINLYGAMTGYDPIVANPEDPINDLGVKGRIFLHDCKDGYYDFVSDVRPDLQCDSEFSTKTISSMSQYNKERQSTLDFSASTKVSASGGYYGVSAEASASYALAMDSSEKAAEKVLKEYNGEIVLSQATCITNSVSISEFVRPVFTRNFIETLVGDEHCCFG